MIVQFSPIRATSVRIEQSQLELSAQSSLSRELIRIRQVSPPATPARAIVDRVVVGATASDFGDNADGQLLLMRLVVEMMMGRRVHLFHVAGKGRAVEVQPPKADPPQGEVRSLQVRVEAEQVRFHARGSVATADGRRIDFQSDLALSRQFVEIVTSEEASGQQDPLVLNFDGRGVRLLGDRIGFDLNGDGQSEAVPLVAPGSGILFADRNGDGVATDGTELFGPRSGSGFDELARQDSDENGWIDEGDPVFGELRVWFQAAAGSGSTYTLTDLGIGAISTSRVETPFDLRSTGNVLLGQIRSSGVYLREDGKAGTVSQVDLAV
ncbi:MAG: VCBS repeat-containing protein [Bryobacteraceae bacterium]